MNSDSLSFSASESEDDDCLPSTSLISQTILHLDVDCFYCQCHEVQDPSLRAIPFAIGQKHIIVTSNYVARRFGVKKLMNKTEAQRTCPSLRIIDGSDLTEFRKKSHLIYSEFRKAVQQLKTGAEICVKKGGMDEMFADISQLVNERMNERSNQRAKSDDTNVDVDSLPYFIYGNDHDSAHISIAEDQSGAIATISYDFNVTSSNSAISNWGSIQDREECKRRLLMGAEIAHQLQEKIRSKTEFTTCIGVSVSPMLSKLASDLKKPNSLNLLFPWRSSSIILNMPLRRIPGLGSKILKALDQCLSKYASKGSLNSKKCWTCKDLLDVPRNQIVSSLSEIECSGGSTETMCDLILKRCNGIDTIPIDDDRGCESKTVSVENSFIRGSILSEKAARDKLHLLCERLPHLLVERKKHALKPESAFPETLRLTIRFVDPTVQSGRRPFRTISKQVSISNGRFLVERRNGDDVLSPKDLLCHAFDPMLDTLLQKSMQEINVTRINIAATKFLDVSNQESSNNEHSKQQKVSQFFNCTHSNILPALPPSQHKKSLQKVIDRSKKRRLDEEISHEIDPNILSQLPSHIAREVRDNLSFHQGVLGVESATRHGETNAKTKKRGLLKFFSKKS